MTTVQKLCDVLTTLCHQGKAQYNIVVDHASIQRISIDKDNEVIRLVVVEDKDA